MRAFLRISLLAIVLGAYLAQPMSSQHHDHDVGDRTHCVACLSQASPASTPPLQVEAPSLPRASFGRLTSGQLPPPAQLEPSDFSYSTSPPDA